MTPLLSLPFSRCRHAADERHAADYLRCHATPYAAIMMMRDIIFRRRHAAAIMLLPCPRRAMLLLHTLPYATLMRCRFHFAVTLPALDASCAADAP